MRVETTCSTCRECSMNKCTFFAVSTFTRNSGEFKLLYTGSHSKLGQKKQRGLFTPEQETAYEASRASTAEGKRGAFIDIQASPPRLPQLQRRMSRDAVGGRSDGEVHTARRWPTELIKSVLNEAAIVTVSEDTFRDPAVVPSDLDMVILASGNWLDESGREEHCGWVFSSRACLSAVTKWRNQKFLKLCADGTFRTTFSNWVLIPIGWLSKSYRLTTMRGAPGKVKTWPTHFTPVLWVFASGETTGAYRLGISTLIRYMRAVNIGWDVSLVKQFHADLTATAEKARAELLPDSIRVADFWHLSEAIQNMLSETLGESSPHRKDFLDWVYMTRTQCITLTEHHNLWALLLKQFAEVIPDAVAAFKERYCLFIPRQKAEQEYGVSNPSMMQQSHLFCTLQWAGLGRLQPGSIGGEAAQESYHRSFNQHFQRPDGRRLRKAKPDEVVPALSVAVKIMGQDVSGTEVFYDIPYKADPSLMDGQHLLHLGRSTAVELYDARHLQDIIHIRDIDGWGTVCIMPRSLYKEQWTVPAPGKDPVKYYVPMAHEELRISPAEAHNVAVMALERDGKRLYRLWQRLGIVGEGRTRKSIVLNGAEWHRLRYKYVIVLWDKCADRFWKMEGRNMKNCLCNCLAFGIWAGCEHEQCARALLDKDFDLKVAGQGSRSGIQSGHLHVRIPPGGLAEGADPCENSAAAAPALPQWDIGSSQPSKSDQGVSRLRPHPVRAVQVSQKAPVTQPKPQHSKHSRATRPQGVKRIIVKKRVAPSHLRMSGVMAGTDPTSWKVQVVKS